MKRLFVPMALGAALVILLAAGCSQPASAPPTAAPAPTAAPKAAEPTKPAAATAAPTKAAEPTKPAAAAAPTAVPAKKVDFPQKGKAIQIIVPYPAGGSTDVIARLLTPSMEKELGAPVEIVNKGGAGGQIGLTDAALAKPDGYTLGAFAIPSNNLYLDPNRDVAYKRESFEPVSMHVKDVILFGSLTTSPYKSMKDVIDGSLAKPGSIKIGSVGVGSITHLALAGLEKMTGAKFGIVQFDGDAPAMTALLGGHIDVLCAGARSFMPPVRAGQARVYGVMDKQAPKFFPEAKTAESEGYKIYFASAKGYVAPAKTPKEVIEVLDAAMKKSITDPEHIKKLDEAGMEMWYMRPADFAQFWINSDRDTEPLFKAVSVAQK